MRHRIFKSLFVLSIPLGVAIAAMWVRSYWRWDYCYWEGAPTSEAVQASLPLEHVFSFVYWHLDLENGHITFERRHFRTNNPFSLQFEPEPGFSHTSTVPFYFHRGDLKFGFGFANEKTIGSGTSIDDLDLTVPFWFIFIVVIIGPSFRILLMFCKKKGRWFTCAHCGYDLTGNVSGACPECGFTLFALAVLTVADAEA